MFESMASHSRLASSAAWTIASSVNRVLPEGALPAPSWAPGRLLAQARNFFEIVGVKSGVTGEPCDLCGVEFHVRTESLREGERASGTISFQVGTQWFPGRLSAR